MGFRERAEAMAEARAEVHEEFKIPVMFFGAGEPWRVVFCRLHESVNPDGVRLGSGSDQISISSSNPQAIFRKDDVPDLGTKTSIVSVSPGKAYVPSKIAPADRYGFVTVMLAPAPKSDAYPVPDWDAL
ncbi:hypothetical protein [Paenirhodobacter populi]|uniref:Uncharacterized protein n=1 Tax=Paenirhodobacter populi TaxID=2306993 RepID=A0A443J035_9RHOB|nr:hypothetical protein [Sinirhodobacter populi]RWR13831.1 hypothetical protein D2T33_05380 [Sinirhodobacter populi]